MRYLGNKNLLCHSIVNEIQKRVSIEAKIFDCFGGTGCVSRSLLNTFKNVSNCDINYYAHILCYCRLKVAKSVDISDTVKELNTLEPIVGFITKYYSPEANRKYFTVENAMKIDAIRTKIETLYKEGNVSHDQYILLLGNLIESVSRFSNIPGTYGAFNENWDTRAIKPFVLEEHIELGECTGEHSYHGDTKQYVMSGDFDVLYMDPPYNQRNYASYYHVLEMVAKYDESIEIKDNKTGTPTSVVGSAWCSKTKCVDELKFYIENTKAKVVVLSYNNEGIIPCEEIEQLFKKYGKYELVEIDHKRFTCNGKGDSKVVERLHILTKTDDWKNKIFNEECILGMSSHIPDKSVDLICTDLPYGLTECKWDTPINLEHLWREYLRVLKPYGNIVLFGQQPFSSKLVSSNFEMFKYSLVWKKSKPGGFAQAPYKVLCEHEDILIFSNAKTSKNARHRMTYNPQGTVPCEKVMKGKSGNTEHRKGRKTQSDYVQTVTNYPRSVLEFKNEGKVIHPTQKPLDLIEYIVKTFSNENDVVLDSCIGSGTVAVACVNTNRTYVGFEKDENIFNACMNRIKLK
jgi:site-specific DNA-methyltransferase (adenine-specific)